MAHRASYKILKSEGKKKTKTNPGKYNYSKPKINSKLVCESQNFKYKNSTHEVMGIMYAYKLHSSHLLFQKIFDFFTFMRSVCMLLL